MYNRFQDRIEFRQSPEWHSFRDTMYSAFSGCDYITSATLQDNWNLHHLNVSHESYTDLSTSANFIPLNKETHTLVHSYFDAGRQYVSDNSVSGNTLQNVLERMYEINKDNIEVILFQNKIDYHFDESDKDFTCNAVKLLNIPNRNGWLYWNRNTPGCPADCPTEVVPWIKWLREKYNYNSDDTLLALELRHLCLYSSLKNLQRADVRAKNSHWKEHEEILRKELPATTQLINKYIEWRNK